jgi:hypothetical protein
VNIRSGAHLSLSLHQLQVKHAGVSSIPIQVSSQWTRTLDNASVQVSYRFVSSALPESIRIVNDVVIFSTSIPDGHELVQSSPTAEWCVTLEQRTESKTTVVDASSRSLKDHKLTWKVPYIFDGSGTLSATISTALAPSEDADQEPTPKAISTNSIVHVNFLGENALFSSIDFDFACRGYRISLLKKKISSGKTNVLRLQIVHFHSIGKYQSEPDPNEPLQLFRRPSADSHRLSLSVA